MRLRTTTEPNEIELITLMKEDSIGRNQELRYLMRLLDANPEGLSVFLNGAWGSGKSYFVRQAELLLRALNPNLKDVDGLTLEEARDVVGREEKSTEQRQYLPVYFNAWRHDAFGEPVLSLMCDIADMEGIRPEGSWDKNSFKGLLINIAKCLVKATLPAGAPDLTDEAADMFKNMLNLFKSAEDPLEEYHMRKKLDQYVDKLVRQALVTAGNDKEPADAIVMFVDELDRCRPIYAIEVLESIKHLLARPDVVVIFSVDARQLIEAIRGAYGMSYDAERYLRRFYDVLLLLPEVNMAKFTEKTLGQAAPITQFDHVAQELMGNGELVMRDAAQLYEMLSHVHTQIVNCTNKGDLDTIVNDALCPLVCYLQITSQDDLEGAVLRGEISDSMYACINKSTTLRKTIDEAISKQSMWTNPHPTESHDNIRKEFLRDLLLVYLTREGVRAHQDALERLHETETDLRRRRGVLRDVLDHWAIQVLSPL